MFYQIGKVVQLFLHPFLIAMIFMGVSIWLLSAAQKSRTGLRLLIFTFVFLLLASLPIIPWKAIHYLESRYPSRPIEAYPALGTILVLGGTTVPTRFPRYEPEELGGSRLLPVARLYHAHKANLIMVTGGDSYIGTRGEKRSETGDMKQILIDMGVPAQNIVVQDQSRNTEEDVRFSAKLLSALQRRKVLLVTNAMHMRRALAFTTGTDIEFVPVPVGHESIDVPLQLQSFLPEAGALADNSRVIKEVVGFLTAKWLRAG